MRLIFPLLEHSSFAFSSKTFITAYMMPVGFTLRHFYYLHHSMSYRKIQGACISEMENNIKCTCSFANRNSKDTLSFCAYTYVETPVCVPPWPSVCPEEFALFQRIQTDPEVSRAGFTHARQQER